MVGFIVLLCLGLPAIVLTSVQDECPDDGCTSHTVEDANGRLFDSPGDTHCDNEMDAGWYKFQFPNGGAGLIPETCIKNNLGGTVLPLRLVLPSQGYPAINETIIAHVCSSYAVLGKWDCCVLRQRVCLRNCDGYYVYYLKAPDRCPVRYVVQRPENNPSGEYTLKTGENSGDPSSDILLPVSTDSSASLPGDNFTESITTANQPTSTISVDTETTAPCGHSDSSLPCFNNMRRCVNVSDQIKVLCSDGVGCGIPCDFFPQCADESDEAAEINCGGPSCTESELACDDGSGCYTRCNGNSECTDGSDERGCNPTSRAAVNTESSTSSSSTTVGDTSSTSHIHSSPSSAAMSTATTLDSLSPSDGTTLQDSSTQIGPATVQTSTASHAQTATSTLYLSTEQSNMSTHSLATAAARQTKAAETNAVNVTETTESTQSSYTTSAESTTLYRTVHTTQPETETSTDYVNDTAETTSVDDTGTPTRQTHSSTPVTETHASSSIRPEQELDIATSSHVSASTSVTTDHVDTSQTEISRTTTENQSTVSGIPTQRETFVPTTGVIGDADRTSTIVIATTTDTPAVSNDTFSSSELTSAPTSSTVSDVIERRTATASTTISARDMSTSTLASTQVTETSTTGPLPGQTSTRIDSQTSGQHTSSTLDVVTTVISSSPAHTTDSLYRSMTTSMAPTVPDSSTAIDITTTTTTTAPTIQTTLPSTATTIGPVLSSQHATSVNPSTTTQSTVVSSSAPTTRSPTETSVLSTSSTRSRSTTTETSSRPPSTTTSSLAPTTATTRMSTTSTTTVRSSPMPTSRSTLQTSTAPSATPNILTETTTKIGVSLSSSTTESSTPPSTSYSVITETTTADNTSSVSNVTTFHPREKTTGIFGDNPGLFIFLIAATIVVFCTVVFAIVGLLYFRRLRTWSPEMSFQDAYAETDSTTPPYKNEKQGLESPIPDVDILRGEQADSPSKASTLVCGPTLEKVQTMDETGQNGYHSNPAKPAAVYADLNTGQENGGFVGEEAGDGEGVVPIDDLDQFSPRNMFPWIETAEDTKL